jgi:hypothetical protein
MNLTVSAFQSAIGSFASLHVYLMRGGVGANVLERYAGDPLCWTHPAVSVAAATKPSVVAMVTGSMKANVAALENRATTFHVVDKNIMLYFDFE